MTGKIISDPLFVGLTRVPMIFGVSIKYAVINLMGSFMIFMYGSSMLALFVAVTVHFIGYIACFQEPRLVEIFLNKNAKCGKCYNRFFYGANSYYV